MNYANFNPAQADAMMPFLAEALDPATASRALREALGKDAEVIAARLVRHKPGRRCLIEYELDLGDHRTTLFGKVRAKGVDESICSLHETLTRAGFDAASADGISVPEAVGVVPRWKMWLQRKVSGVPATALLPGTGGAAVARRLAEAAYKLHLAGVPANRVHTMADELAILRARLPLAGEAQPAWADRIARLLDACECLGASIRETPARGIHRDFYPDQALVDFDRLWLVDFDLYCLGDPALDIGNCLAHITEQALRTPGDQNVLTVCEEALEERWLELAGAEHRAAVRAYATLSLARHIHISTLFAERRAFTEPLLALCERRVKGQ